MDDQLWEFIDACGAWVAQTYGMPPVAGRVVGCLLVCDPPEQTAAQLAEAIDASAGAISGATGTLVRLRLVERMRIRGERADRFRIRPGVWDDQLREEETAAQARALFAIGLRALADAPSERRERLEELDAFYAFYQSRMNQLWEEWREYKRVNLGGRTNG